MRKRNFPPSRFENRSQERRNQLHNPVEILRSCKPTVLPKKTLPLGLLLVDQRE